MDSGALQIGQGAGLQGKRRLQVICVSWIALFGLVAAFNGGFIYPGVLPQGFSTHSANQTMQTPTPATGSVPISPENARNVRALAHLGEADGTRVLWSPDGKTLAVNNSVGIWLYSIDNLNDGPRKLSGYEATGLGDNFSPDGKLLAVISPPGCEACPNPTSEPAVELWDVKRRVRVKRLLDRTELISSAVFSPDGRTLASGSVEKTVRVWDLSSGRLLHILNGHTDAVSSLVFSPDGKLLASGSADHTVVLWDPSTGRSARIIDDPSGCVNSVAFSPDGKLLATGSANGGLTLWDVPSGNVRLRLAGHSGDVFTVAFSPDGKVLASGSNDHTVRLWAVGTGQLLTILKGHTNYLHWVAFSPDGKTLASYGSYSADDETLMTVFLWGVPPS